MNLLVDTHVFIWSIDEPEKLPQQISDALQDAGNKLFLSYASIWEMQIKVQLNKLTFKQGLRQSIDFERQQNDLELLPIELTHIYELEKLPYHHKDPFDRLLIAQALVEKLTLVSVDPNFPAYGVKLLT